jgi:hypothetical protein
MGMLLTTSSDLLCPHGGTVSAVSSNTRTKAGDPVLRTSDTFTIAGCPFTLPPSTPHPCVTVQWVVAALRTKVLGDAVLTTDSVGMCQAADQAPQGTVLVNQTQTQVSGL